MGPIALLLHGDPSSPDARRLRALLDFFEVPCHSLSTGEFRGSVEGLVENHGRHVVMVSAEALAEVCERDHRSAAQLCRPAASVYVYGWKPTDACRALLRQISGDARADIHKFSAQNPTVSIADDFEAMCGPMSGLNVELAQGAADTALTFALQPDGFRSLARVREGQLFAALDCAGTSFLVDASPAPIDIHQLATSPFDVKESFSGSVAMVMYLKWAFHDIWWNAPELNACLTLDDLLLKEQHGYFEYPELLRLIERYGIAATIAFIPWNWRRREGNAVKAAQSNTGRLSLCMHGCDHSRNEFAIRSEAWLDARVKGGKKRMSRLQAETGIPHGQVQIFPQGKFCPELGAVLKQNGLTAAVNTEPAPLDRGLNRTTIADQWSVANLRYGGFPIFSRRHIHCGVENFAFDGLLGKPCLIGGHHDLFHDGSQELIAFLEKLQSLRWNLTWRTLEDALCRSYKVRESVNAMRVQMVAERLDLENTAHTSKAFTVSKKVSDTGIFKKLTVDGQPHGFEYAEGKIHFTLHLEPGAHARIACEYAGKQSLPAVDPLTYQVKVAMLRHLTVMRDTWVSKKGLMNRSTVLAMRIRNQFGE